MNKKGLKAFLFGSFGLFFQSDNIVKAYKAPSDDPTAVVSGSVAPQPTVTPRQRPPQPQDNRAPPAPQPQSTVTPRQPTPPPRTVAQKLFNGMDAEAQEESVTNFFKDVLTHYLEDTTLRYGLKAMSKDINGKYNGPWTDTSKAFKALPEACEKQGMENPLSLKGIKEIFEDYSSLPAMKEFFETHGELKNENLPAYRMDFLRIKDDNMTLERALKEAWGDTEAFIEEAEQETLFEIYKTIDHRIDVRNWFYARLCEKYTVKADRLNVLAFIDEKNSPSKLVQWLHLQAPMPSISYALERLKK